MDNNARSDIKLSSNQLINVELNLSATDSCQVLL